jgi:hypothetical protein
MHNKKPSAPDASGNKESRPWPDRYIVEQPTKAAATAVGVGFFLNFLPLGKIVGALVDIAFVLVRPLLLCFGLVKLYDYCRSCSLCDEKSEQTKTTKP